MNDIFETHKVSFEIYIEDNLVNSQTMQAPKEILIANFLQTVDQISKDKRPLKIKMVRPEIIWDKFEKKEKTLNNEICFSNNAMIAFEKDK